MLDKYRVTRTGITDEWIDVMVDDSQYFPHHLTVALRVTASHLVQNDGTMSKEGLVAVREEALQQRQEFYRRRISNSHQTPREVVGEVARALQSDPTSLGQDNAQATKAVLEILTALKGSSATQEAATEIVNALIHFGILQLDPSIGCFTIPIPSFQTWAAKELTIFTPTFPHDSKHDVTR